MNIFESLENLNVSEECFGDIVGIVEELLSEELTDYIKKVHGNSEKGKKLWDKAVSNIGNEVSSSIDREVNKINPKAFNQYSDKSPSTVKREFKDKIRDKQNDRRYADKNSIGAAKTDMRRVSTGIEALENRIKRSNKEYDNFRTDRSIKRNAVKKFKDFMKGRKSPEPKKDLSQKVEFSDWMDTKNGYGEYYTTMNQFRSPIALDRLKDDNSAKYRPEVKSIARNMKKSHKLSKASEALMEEIMSIVENMGNNLPPNI